ncbi:MAG: formyltransferase family protein [Pseudomonadota bacterium]
MSTPRPIERLLLLGDDYGIPELLAHVPRERVVGIVATANRPQYHATLAALAAEAGLPLLIQPPAQETEAAAQFITQLAALAPDGLLCHSYAMLVRPPMLALVDGHAFNVHAALLPRHRGPNPVQWALIHGDTHTGITLHQMSEGFDSGAILAQQQVPITPEDTWVTLHARIREQTPALLQRALPGLLSGHWHATAQDERLALHNPRITRDSFRLDASMSDRAIYNLIRAQVAPLAGAYADTPQGRIRFPDFVPLHDIPALRTRLQTTSTHAH